MSNSSDQNKNLAASSNSVIRGHVEKIQIEKTKSLRTRPAEDNLGFGRHFTDHMFRVDYDKATGWTSACIAPYQSLVLDPAACVLHYGQAIFEGMKAYRNDDGRVLLFRPKQNWERMTSSARRLCMQMPSYETFLSGLLSLTRIDEDWIPKSSGAALYLRPTLLGTEAFLGVRPSDQYLFFVIASPVGNYYGGESLKAVNIWVEETYSRATPGGVGAAKAAGNYASSLLAAVEAKASGYDQVLWLDACQKKYIEEVGTMNVFFYIDDQIITPPLNGAILPGITRMSVIELLRSEYAKSQSWYPSRLDIQERPITMHEVQEAHKQGRLKEVFGTGTAASISPVGSFGLKDQKLKIGDGKVGPISSGLYQLLTDIQYGRVPDPFAWTVEVPKEI